jgi:hypothetical protein
MKRALCLFASVALTGLAAKAGVESESFYDVQLSSTTVDPGSYLVFGQDYVGYLFGTENRVMVTPIQLPYIAPGVTITGASMSWGYVGKNGTPATNVDVDGLSRISTSPAVTTADYYIGPNDPASTTIQQGLVTPSTPFGTVTCSNATLLSWIQSQYAAFTAQGTSDLAARFVFFRLNGNALENQQSRGNINYLFASSDNLRPLIPTLTLTATGTATPTAGRLQFAFTLATNQVTSAGVYQNGALVRTLWSNVPYTAGTNYGAWDGNDDFGNALAAGTYQIRLLTNGVTYNFDGAIGNTSAATSGGNVWRSNQPVQSMDIAGTTACYAVGYNEGQCAFNNFNTSTPQVTNQIYTNAYGLNDPFSAFSLVAYDGSMSYWAKTAAAQGGAYTYIIGLDGTNTPHTFPSGSTIPSSGQQKYTNAIDLDTSSTSTSSAPNPATGLALQHWGTFLFASHGNLNVIRVFNKVTGALVNTISAPNPGVCATDAAGNLYVVEGTTVQQYTIDPESGAGTAALTITGLSGPIGIGCDPTTTTVTVIDNSTLKAFDTTTGNALWTYGGAQTIPQLSTSAWLFGPKSFVAYGPDGTFWIGDQLNRRILHYAVSGATVSYIEQVDYQNVFYTTSVDPNAISQVFGYYSEYTVDYTKPIGGLNGSWTLLNNWAAGLPYDSTHDYIDSLGGLNGGYPGTNNVVTLNNGHRYALFPNSATGNYDVFDITSNAAPAVNTGVSFSHDGSGWRIYADGTLRHTAGIGTGTITLDSQPLTGFTGTNPPVPQWGSPVALASAPQGNHDPEPSQHQGYDVRIEQTTGGYYPVYGADKTSSNRYHFGVLTPGGTSWLARTMPNAPGNYSYSGRMPRDGHFDSGNGVNYAGNVLTASGRNLFLGYHGELWKGNVGVGAAEASTFYHYNEDGLMIGSWGTLGHFVGFDSTVDGFAGNNFSQTAVTGPTGVAYLYTNDESNHGGITRWSISNLGSVAETVNTGALGQVISLGPPPAPTGLSVSQVSGYDTLTWTASSGAASYTVLRSTTTGSGYVPIASGVTGTTYSDSGATAGLTYYYVVTATDGGGTSGNSNEASFTPLPAPTALTGLPLAASVQLSWTGSANATGYNIKRGSTSGGPYATIGTASTGSFTDTTVSPGLPYDYVVTATNAGGESLNSNEFAVLSPFQKWLAAYNLPISTAPSATPDNDGVSLLMKYATNLIPGTPSAAGPATVSSSGDFLTLQFSRLTPAPVNYLVESSSDLVHWSSLATLLAGATSWTGPATVMESGSGPILVTVTDTASLSNGIAPRFLRLRVTTATDTTEPSTVPAGDIPVTINGASTTATSLPLDNTPLARNAVQAVTSSTLTVVNAGTWVTTATPCALRLLSGQGSGRTFSITAQAGNVLTLASLGVNLIQLVAPGDLYEILPLDTLSSLYGSTSPLLTTGISPNVADTVLMWNGTTWVTYFDYLGSWRQVGSFSTFNNTPLPLGAGVLITRHGASAVKYQIIGRVPEVALSQYTAPGGTTFLGGAYPLSTTIGTMGFATAPAWASGISPNVADNVLVWNGTTWLTFFRYNSHWYQVGILSPSDTYSIQPGQPLLVIRHSSPSAINAFVPQPLNYVP